MGRGQDEMWSTSSRPKGAQREAMARQVRERLAREQRGRRQGAPAYCMWNRESVLELEARSRSRESTAGEFRLGLGATPKDFSRERLRTMLGEEVETKVHELRPPPAALCMDSSLLPNPVHPKPRPSPTQRRSARPPRAPRRMTPTSRSHWYIVQEKTKRRVLAH